VALVLFHDGCDACRTLLVRLAKDNASFREKNAVALAVGADGSAAAERLGSNSITHFRYWLTRRGGSPLPKG
jgi:hypothetical protein